MKPIFKWIFINSAILIGLGCFSCSQNPDILSADNSNDSAQLNDLNFNNNHLLNGYSDQIEVSEKQFFENDYYQYGSCITRYIEQIQNYSAAHINIPNGSSLKIPAKSLVPPDSLSGTDITISMAVSQINNELIFTFGPHGCEFKEPAILCLSWKDLNCNNATLHYLDEAGNRIEHLPDQIDKKNKLMFLEINHFSRYAVAYSN